MGQSKFFFFFLVFSGQGKPSNAFCDDFHADGTVLSDVANAVAQDARDVDVDITALECLNPTAITERKKTISEGNLGARIRILARPELWISSCSMDYS